MQSRFAIAKTGSDSPHAHKFFDYLKRSAGKAIYQKWFTTNQRTIQMSAIAIPEVLGKFVITTLTFEDLANLDGEELGPARSPYGVIGLLYRRRSYK